VLLVTLKKTSVKNVLVTESTHTSVIAQILPMTTELHSVQIVLKNVKLVTTCQITVLNVLKEESIHQNVTFQNQLLNLLKSET